MEAAFPGVGGCGSIHPVRVRDQLAEAAGRGPLAIPDTIVLSVIGAPTFQPATNTLDAALASGEIDLIQNDEIRRELAQWRTTLADPFESEQEVRRITSDRLEPILSRNVALGPYYDIAVAWDAGAVKGLVRKQRHPPVLVPRFR